MTIQKRHLKAKQAKIDEANRLEQDQIIKENLFISAYTGNCPSLRLILHNMLSQHTE